MAFSSVQFLFVFLPLSLAVYWLCPKWLRNAVLAAFSLLFFAWAGLKGAAILVLLAGILGGFFACGSVLLRDAMRSRDALLEPVAE